MSEILTSVFMQSGGKVDFLIILSETNIPPLFGGQVVAEMKPVQLRTRATPPTKGLV